MIDIFSLLFLFFLLTGNGNIIFKMKTYQTFKKNTYNTVGLLKNMFNTCLMDVLFKRYL